MNEHKHYRITYKINNSNKYSSPTVNDHNGDRYPKKLADFIVENRTCSSWTIKSYDFIGRQNRPTLSIV